MLYDFLKANVGENGAPFVAVAIFVVIVGAALWITPRLARWIDSRRNLSKGFYDGMLEQPPEDTDKE